MTLTIQEWHNRFISQAHWTQSLRNYLFQIVRIEKCKQVLEVGCGSGAILRELPQFTQANIFGVDINLGFLQLAMRNIPDAHLLHADAYHLPLPPQSFDLTFCHFLLLWLTDPYKAITEMIRVTRPGGYLCILAEPDYGGRIDFPDELSILGQKQTIALRKQGANPEIGRSIRGLLTNAGLTNVVSGVLGGQWEPSFDVNEWISEWKVLEADLAEDQVFQDIKEKQKAQDKIAWAGGTRILFVPTFYGWGVIPD